MSSLPEAPTAQIPQVDQIDQAAPVDENTNLKDQQVVRWNALQSKPRQTPYPPSCNTGGTSSVVGGGALPKRHKTIVDTISWTVQGSLDRPFDDAAHLGSFVLGLFPPDVRWSEPLKGQNGYPSMRQLLFGSLILGWLSYGASHGRLWLYIGGAGLRTRRDYGLEDVDLLSICALNGCRFKRCDIALDIYSHEQFSVQKSKDAFLEGGYRLPKSPKDPHEEEYISSTGNPDFPKAITHYIGKPDASKRVRVYDKGLQVLGRMTKDEIKEFRESGVLQSGDIPAGRHIEEWTRCELIYTHDKRRLLDPCMLIDPDAFFAGSYPLLASIIEDVTVEKRPKYIPRETDICIASMMSACRASYGGLIYFMRHDMKLSDEEIVAHLVGPKKAARLELDRENPN